MIITTILALQLLQGNQLPPQVRTKIQLLVESQRLKDKGRAYCTQITDYILQASKRADIDPYIIATTGYHESRFVMINIPRRTTRAQLGIMQFTEATWNSNFGPKGKLLRGLDRNSAKDNILAGAVYLKQNLLATRGDERGMWRRYNEGNVLASRSGGYSPSSYTRECQRTVGRLRTWSAEEVQTYLKSRKEL